MDINSIEKALTGFGGNNIQYFVNRSAREDSININIVTTTKINRYDLLKVGHKEIINSIVELKDNLLSSDLFRNERESLKEYEKLKNMQFVLNALKELDLSSIKEVKKENDYLNVQSMLSGKNV